jgi:hypothetical protein
MKKLLPLLFLLLPFIASSQNSDSTEIKLLQYKQWLDKGLIEKPEYDLLKQKLLKRELTEPGAPSAPVPEPVPVSPQPKTEPEKAKAAPAPVPVQEVYRPSPADQLASDFIPGRRKADTLELSKLKSRYTGGFIAGSMFIASGGLCNTAIAADWNLPTKVTFLVFGNTLVVAGIITLALAGKDKHIYTRRKQHELVLGPSKTGLGFAMQF